MRLLLVVVLELASGQRFSPSSLPWHQPADPNPPPWHQPPSNPSPWHQPPSSPSPAPWHRPPSNPSPWHQPPSSPSPAPWRPWSPTTHQHAPAPLHQGADVVLTSSGGARRWKASTLGRYRALPGRVHAYRKEATRARPALFLYKVGTRWYVSRQLRTRGGFLRAQDLGGAPGGWEFWRRGWRADPTLVAREAGSSSSSASTSRRARCSYSCRAGGACTVSTRGRFGQTLQGRCDLDGCTSLPRQCQSCKEKCEGRLPTNYQGCYCTWRPWSSWSRCLRWGQQGRERRCEGASGCVRRQREGRRCDAPTTTTTTTTTSPPTSPPRGGACASTRVRREISSLSPPAQWRLRSALRRAVQSGGFQEVAAFHGFPGTICGSAGRPEACCPHMEDVAMFLPWHRLLMAQMEEVLGAPLPYWDWTSTAAFPSLLEDTWDAIGNSGPHGQGLCPKEHAMYAQRRQGAALIDPRRLQRATDLALRKENFEEFARQLSQPHNDVHNAFECNLRNTDFAAFDPVFYLHHGQVDRLFAYWQELQRLRGLPAAPAAPGRPVPPFHDPRHNRQAATLAHSTTPDTLDYSNNFCYSYDQLVFAGRRPAEWLQARADRFRPSTGGLQLGLEVGSDYFIGVVLPKMAASGSHPFLLCSALRCVPAGEASTFGKAMAAGAANTTVSAATHYIVEVEVTEVVTEEEWFTTSLHAEMADAALLGVPQPFLIERFADESRGGEVTVGRGGAAAYGDMLDSYSYTVREEEGLTLALDEEEEEFEFEEEGEEFEEEGEEYELQLDEGLDYPEGVEAQYPYGLEEGLEYQAGSEEGFDYPEGAVYDEYGGGQFTDYAEQP